MLGLSFSCSEKQPKAGTTRAHLLCVCESQWSFHLHSGEQIMTEFHLGGNSSQLIFIKISCVNGFDNVLEVKLAFKPQYFLGTHPNICPYMP